MTDTGPTRAAEDRVLFERGPMKTYRRARLHVDAWFAAVQERYASQMKCGRGCAMCCHGLFDVGVPDALELTAALGRMAPPVLARVRQNAESVHERILEIDPTLKTPFLFRGASDERIGRILGALTGAACPLLGPDGECRVYAARPMACRVEGVPLVDSRDGRFSDWCELNFTGDLRADDEYRLARDWTALTETEDAAARALSETVATRGEGGVAEARSLIPSIVVTYESYWKPLLEELSAAYAGGGTTTSA